MLDSVDDQSYWTHLGSIGIQSVHAEADKIKFDQESVNNGTRTLAFEHYSTFIATSDCGKDAAVHLRNGRQHAEKLSAGLPPLREACVEFESESKMLSARRKNTSQVLARHTKLLEILELPQLVETCVRNGHYEEAMELTQYTMRVEKKLGSIPIVAEIAKAVKQSSKVMLNQLVSQLRAPIQLPACLKVVGYLRRMDAFGETELRLKFLQARDSWLNSVLNGVPRDDPYDHLTKYLELARVHLFDIVTQYRALFSDEDPLAVDQSQASHRLLFGYWLERKLTGVLETARRDLGAGARKQGCLDALLGQAMFFGQSFAKFGADFRCLTVTVFAEAALATAAEHLDGCEARFRSGLNNMAFKAKPAAAAADAGKADSAADDPYQPPLKLLDFPPLAELCNSILSCLNEIRLCVPIAIAPKIVGRVGEILAASAKISAERELRFGTSSIETEKVAFQEFVNVFSKDFLPFIDRCLKRIFPAADLKKYAITAKSSSIDLAEIRRRLPLKNPDPAAAEEENEPETVDFVADRAAVISGEIDGAANHAEQNGE